MFLISQWVNDDIIIAHVEIISPFIRSKVTGCTGQEKLEMYAIYIKQIKKTHTYLQSDQPHRWAPRTHRSSSSPLCRSLWQPHPTQTPMNANNQAPRSNRHQILKKELKCQPRFVLYFTTTKTHTVYLTYDAFNHSGLLVFNQLQAKSMFSTL